MVAITTTRLGERNNMEQPENETTKREIQLVLGDDNDEEKVQEQDSEIDGLRQPNATFLTDLNLLIVALSLMSSICDEEDCLNLVDTDQKKDMIKDDEANNCKACIPTLHARKKETNDFKLMRRQTQKSQTIPKDFRHCRKM